MRLLISICFCLLLLFVTACTSATKQDISKAAFSKVVTAKTATEHFHPKGKMPSTYTVELQQQLREALPFQDKQDFEEQKKGFIAAPDYEQIMAEAGHVAWDMGRYEFLLEGKEFDSIHPSLQRQAILNMNYGLYEVIPGIYQVRGYDLANISFIKSKTGWIIFDPLTARGDCQVQRWTLLMRNLANVRSLRWSILIRTSTTLVVYAWCGGGSRCQERQGQDHCTRRLHGSYGFRECLCR